MAAWASEPRMSCRQSRQSKEMDSVNCATSAPGPRAKRPLRETGEIFFICWSSSFSLFVRGRLKPERRPNCADPRKKSLRNVARSSVKNPRCRRRANVECFSGSHERIQICVSGVRPAHQVRLVAERHGDGMPDVFPENHRAASAGIGRPEIHHHGHENGRTRRFHLPWQMRA